MGLANKGNPKFSAALKTSNARPEVRARRSAAQKMVWQRMHPRDRERRVAERSAAAAANHGPRGRPPTSTWCPADLVESYRLISRKVGAREARRIIKAEIERRKGG
jgi:hypothetical protein